MTDVILTDMAKKSERWHGNQVAALRAAYGYTYEEFARALGLSSYVSAWRWEHGKAHPSRMASDVLTLLEKRLKRERPDVVFVRPDPPQPAPPPKKRAKK